MDANEATFDHAFFEVEDTNFDLGAHRKLWILTHTYSVFIKMVVTPKVRKTSKPKL